MTGGLTTESSLGQRAVWTGPCLSRFFIDADGDDSITTRHHGSTETIEKPTALCRSTTWVRRRHSHRTEHLITVGILLATIFGCSQDGSSITTAAPCSAPAIEPSESMLVEVGSPDAGPAGGSWVTLKWDASSNIIGYRMYIGTRSQNYQQVTDVGLLTISMVSNLASNRTYYFAVTAYNAAGESCPSNEVSIHIP